METAVQKTQADSSEGMHQSSGHFGRPDNLTIYDLIRVQAHRKPNAFAIGAPGRTSLSYTRLLEQVEQTVSALRSAGIQRNDRVALVLPNGPEMAVSFVAVAAGATCAPLNPAYRASEFDFYLSDLSARALIIPEGMSSPAREVAQERGVPIIELLAHESREAGTFDLAVRSTSKAGADMAEHDDIALILHTSGTTSRPKMVPLSQSNLCYSAHHIAQTIRLGDDDRCLNVMPLFHIHGLIGAVMSSITAGAGIVCTPGFAAERFFEWLDSARPTWYTAVPTIHQAIVSGARNHRDIISRVPLRLIRSSSASLPPPVMAELEKVFDTQVIESYGMTEASHQMTSNPLAPRARKPGSVGIAAGPDVAIMNDEGRLLPVNQVGEVVIRGANVTKGYEANPAANQTAFTNGWFRTGDQGYFDEEGYLFLKGRLKEIINRGGEKIAPREIDDVLLQHPAVGQAVAFAVPHPSLGEDVGAAVVLKAGAQATDSEIRDFAAQQLADFKVPRQLLILDEIPKGATGKIQRIGLAEKLKERLAAKLESTYVAAASSVETEIATIWTRLLKLDRVGMRDDFHAQGGDSLAMATMLIEVEERFRVQIPVDEFLKAPTIETIARCVQNKGPEVKAATADDERPGKPLSDTFLVGVKNRLLQILALYSPGYMSTRVWLHRMRGVTIGRNVSIGLSAIIETAYPKLVFIGNNVTIGMRALVIGHLRESTVEARARHRHTVRIEDDVYIGPGVIILPNVTIGRGSVVSAGSVVSRSIPAQTLAQGNPAKPIAKCGVSLGGGVSYEEFLRHLTPVDGQSL
jgi:acyl-CoA synthetase (AMP-forming)/AMP-acid ligase II/acetyltransferase-like isoleucine patch superfamily enzyme/acyl carrier protein